MDRETDKRCATLYKYGLLQKATVWLIALQLTYASLAKITPNTVILGQDNVMKIKGK